MFVDAKKAAASGHLTDTVAHNHGVEHPLDATVVVVVGIRGEVVLTDQHRHLSVEANFSLQRGEVSIHLSKMRLRIGQDLGVAGGRVGRRNVHVIGMNRQEVDLVSSLRQQTSTPVVLIVLLFDGGYAELN